MVQNKKGKKISLVGILLLIINIPCWGLLIMALLSPFIAPYKLQLPAFAGLAFLWIYLANVILVLLLLFFKAKYAIPGIFLLLTGVPLLFNHLRFTDIDTVPSYAIRVLSFNAQGLSSQYGNARKDKSVADSIFNFIKNTNSDIICIQEFTSTTNNLDAFMDNFSKSVNANTYHFQKYIADAHRLPGTLCLITTSKYPIIKRSPIEYQDVRFGMYTDIAINTDTIRVFNLHLKSTSIKAYDIDFVNDPLHTEGRQEKSKIIYKKLLRAFINRSYQAQTVAKEIQKSPYPVIVCGDFNDTPCSYTYHKISKKLKDSFLESGKGFGQTYNGDLPLMRIDYILHDKNFKAFNFHTHHNYYSDHFPISTYLKIQ